MNKRQKKKRIRLNNKRLTREFPFLLPYNVWTGRLSKDYKYDYTLFDDLPIGWKKTFGIQLCEDLKQELVKSKSLKDYRIHQIKEKYGTLRWYDSGNSEEGYYILDDYEHLSAHTCITCGEVDVPVVDDGWVCPECERCYNKRAIKAKEQFSTVLPVYADVISDATPLTPTYTITRFGSSGKSTITRDITYILNRITKKSHE